MGKHKKTLLDTHFPKDFKGRWKGQFKPPVGILGTFINKRLIYATYEQMNEAGCILAVEPKLFTAIMGKAGNNACNGCAVWGAGGPACKAFQAHHTGYQRFLEAQVARQAETKAAITPHNVEDGPLAGMSIAQIAELYGKSKSFVRNLKAAGKLTVAELEAKPVEEGVTP